jgi:hypothetical protein
MVAYKENNQGLSGIVNVLKDEIKSQQIECGAPWVELPLR